MRITRLTIIWKFIASLYLWWWWSRRLVSGLAFGKLRIGYVSNSLEIKYAYPEVCRLWSMKRPLQLFRLSFKRDSSFQTLLNTRCIIFNISFKKRFNFILYAAFRKFSGREIWKRSSHSQYTKPILGCINTTKTNAMRWNK